LKNSIFKIAVVLALSLITVLYGKVNAQQSLAIGYVDSEVILKQLPETKKAMSDIEALQKLYLDTVQTKEKAIKDKIELYKTKFEEGQKAIDAGKLNEAEIKKLNEELNTLKIELQGMDEDLSVYKQKVQNLLIQKQNELFKPIVEKMTKAIEDIAKQMKIDFVFDKAKDGLLYGDKKFDVTFDVLKKLNLQN
jgi:outer membrane protein